VPHCYVYSKVSSNTCRDIVPEACTHSLNLQIMRGLSSWLSIAAINLLLPVGILLFAKGFFPYKPFLPGLAVFGDEDVRTTVPFDKVVFMVVDALRRYAGCDPEVSWGLELRNWAIATLCTGNDRVSGLPRGVLLPPYISLSA